MPNLPHIPRLGDDPSDVIIAACKAARSRLDAAADALALALAVAELACTMSALEEALIEWALAADPDIAKQARSAIARAARRDA